MSLEALLSTLQTDVYTRITHTSKKRITNTIQQLQHYQLSPQQQRQTSHLAAALRRRHRNGREGYKDLSDQLYTNTNQAVPTHTPMYEQLINSRQHYTNRFSTLENNLETMSEQEAILCLDEIDNNAYLRRKAKNSETFSHERERIKNLLRTRIVRYTQPKKPSLLTKTLYATAGAVMSVAYTYALTPF
ncbi:MAG: hypothetical protein ACMXYD_03050 [Candidatus Woesearchaeota archaeon]